MRTITTQAAYFETLRNDFERAKRLLTPFLRERDGVDFTHIDDIISTLAARHPEVLPTAALLDVDDDAFAYLREQVRLLELDDPELFSLAPNREEYARILASGLQGAKWRDLGENTRKHYWSESDRNDVSGRRREAYRFRQIIAARKAAKAKEPTSA